MMMEANTALTSPITNGLIDGLPDKQRDRVVDQCQPVNLEFGAVLCEPNTLVRNVYFPLTGFISLVSTLNGHKPLEVGLIGNEGMLGATVALGVNAVPLRGIVQGAGSALRLSTAQLRRELDSSPRFRHILKRYLYVHIMQLSQSAACVRFHSINQRLAKWLLMTHDRAHANHFHLTHAFLADMLGVRRSGITNAAGALQIKNLIRYVRGDIQIVDRQGLEAVACECYQSHIDDYARRFKAA